MATVRTVVLVAALVLGTAAKRPPPPSPPPPAVPAPPTIASGVERWRAGDYAAAVAIWTPFAAAGDADALFNLGQAYKLGRGVPTDAAAARDDYRKAAMKGHLPAQANLGIALFQAGDKAEAIKWLKTAADRGEARAQYVLGIAAFNGDGVARSQSMGYAYLLRAQASGLPQAATALGTIAPGLSPTDRAAGEAIAASLAAGTGVPAIAATNAPRPISGAATRTLPAGAPLVAAPPATTAMPVGVATAVKPASSTVAAPPPGSRPAPAAVVASTAPASPSPVRPPSGASAASVPAVRPPLATATVSPGTPSLDRSLPPAPRPVPAIALREPTPAQADAAARQGATARADATPDRDVRAPTAIATVAIPASRPVVPATAPPPTIIPADAASASRGANDPLVPKPARMARADSPPATALRPLKPFEVAANEPAKHSDGWRVQLGAFSSRKLADAAWNDIKATAAPAKPVFATDGPVTKLQMGPFATREAAKAACTRLTAAGRACFVTLG